MNVKVMMKIIKLCLPCLPGRFCFLILAHSKLDLDSNWNEHLDIKGTQAWDIFEFFFYLN